MYFLALKLEKSLRSYQLYSPRDIYFSDSILITKILQLRLGFRCVVAILHGFISIEMICHYACIARELIFS